MGQEISYRNITEAELSDDNFAQPRIFHSIFRWITYENPLSFKGWQGLPNLLAVIKWKWDSFWGPKTPSDDELNQKLPIYNPDFSYKSRLQATWLGHATVLVQMDGLNFITDPVLSSRASPISFIGPKRYRPPPCGIEDYPEIDFAVISHNHYDHLDTTAVRGLNQRFPTMTWYVPIGLKGWMESTIPGANVYEKSW